MRKQGAPERPETTVQNGIKNEKSYDHRIRGVGHIVRNLQHLRRVKRAQKFKGFFLAKYLCGSGHFSNMFCEVFGVPA